jgi:hypothetical protein
VVWGGEEVSDKSTLTYASRESPREDSGTQARRSLSEAIEFADCEEVGLSSMEPAADFCWMRATKPGMLDFAEGDG